MMDLSGRAKPKPVPKAVPGLGRGLMIIWIAMATVAIVGCASDRARKSVSKVSEPDCVPSLRTEAPRLRVEEVIRIAKTFVQGQGYRLEELEEPQAYFGLGSHLLEWTVVFLPKVPTPDAHLLVWVSDQTGAARMAIPTGLEHDP